MGKKHSNKQDKHQSASKDGRRRPRSDGVAISEDDARASFEVALARLEEDAAHKVAELVGRTRCDVDALGAALQELAREAESSSRSAVDRLADSQAKLTARFEACLADVEGHSLAMEASFATIEDRSGEFLARLHALGAEADAQVAGVAQRLDDVVRSQEADLGRVAAHATERIALLEQAVTERAEHAEVEMERRIGSLTARADSASEELRTQAARQVEAYRAGVEEETRGEFRRLVERMRTELAQAGTETQESRARWEMIERLDDALVAETSTWQPAATVEQFVGEVQRAVARIGALSVRAEAYGEIMRTRLEAIDSWFDGLVERTRDVGQHVGDLPDLDELVKSQHDAGHRMAEVEAQTVETLRRTTAPAQGARPTRQDDAEPEGT